MWFLNALSPLWSAQVCNSKYCPLHQCSWEQSLNSVLITIFHFKRKLFPHFDPLRTPKDWFLKIFYFSSYSKHPSHPNTWLWASLSFSLYSTICISLLLFLPPFFSGSACLPSSDGLRLCSTTVALQLGHIFILSGSFLPQIIFH